MSFVPDPKIYWAEDEARHRLQDAARDAERSNVSRRKAPWWLPLLIFGVMIAGALLAIVLIEVL